MLLSASVVTNEYRAVLGKLFAVIKTAPRHILTPDDTAGAFETRQKFFQKQYMRTTRLQNAKCIHVAGTKGKGSTVEFIGSSLRDRGLKVGIFTSPHLHTARERFKIGNELISMEDFTRLGHAAISLLDDQPWPVFFDYLMMMAILYFDEKGVDYWILECGIGGRYDSTNFLENPECVVITSISLDHEAILGSSISDIAWQKTGVLNEGIIKRSGRVFTSAAQAEDAMRVIDSVCDNQRAKLYKVPVDRDYVSDFLSSNLRLYDVFVQNACLAKAVIESLREMPERNATSPSSFFWPCRAETFRLPSQSGHCSDDFEKRLTVILDGCHNTDSVASFLKGVRKVYATSSLLICFGAGSEKSVANMLSWVKAFGPYVTFVQSRHFKSLSENELAQLYHTAEAAAIEPNAATSSSYASPRTSLMEELLQSSRALAQSRVLAGTVGDRVEWLLRQCVGCEPIDVVIVVCGSLFVAAEAREALFRLYPDLFETSDWVRSTDDY